MKYEKLFRKKGQKRWYVASGTPYCGYSTKRLALSGPKSDKYEYKVREINKRCK